MAKNLGLDLMNLRSVPIASTSFSTRMHCLYYGSCVTLDFIHKHYSFILAGRTLLDWRNIPQFNLGLTYHLARKSWVRHPLSYDQEPLYFGKMEWYLYQHYFLVHSYYIHFLFELFAAPSSRQWLETEQAPDPFPLTASYFLHWCCKVWLQANHSHPFQRQHRL